MSRYTDFKLAIQKQTRKFMAYPNWQTELQAISMALGSNTSLHDTTITTPPSSLLIGSDKTAFQNRILHVVNKGYAGNIPPSDMQDAINSTMGLALPPGRIDQPVITGSDGAVGVVHTCTMGNWMNSPTSYAYQWKKLQGGVTSNLPSAINTYTPPSAERGHDFWCTVTATNPAGSASSDSNHLTVH